MKSAKKLWSRVVGWVDRDLQVANLQDELGRVRRELEEVQRELDREIIRRQRAEHADDWRIKH